MRRQNSRFNTRLLCSAAAMALAMASAANARAQDEAGKVQFNIPAQPLTSALNDFGAQSGVAVLFKSEVAGARMSRGFQEAADAETALSAMLQGTGLTYRREGDAFVIVQGGSEGPQSAGAGGDVDALIVTAQKREENIQDVPIAISAFSQEDLTTHQIAGGPDLMTQVPNFTFTKTNFSGYSIQIRGIGTQAISATTDPAVAIAFNNTPFVRNHFFEQEFYDLQRVEVLRGPQGTLYGRNATAGVVNVISSKPTYRFEARASADISNYNSSRFEGMVNLPLVEDTASLRVAAAWTKRDGYVKNNLTGEQTDGRDLWSSRVTLGLDPTDWLNINFIWEHFEEDDDRLRSGKQLCNSDPGPSEINGIPIGPSSASLVLTVGYVSQGCLPGSLYSPDSFDTPNGFALPYYGALGAIGLPVYIQKDPYVNTFQSRNLREIETHLTPEYEANADVLELQWSVDLPNNLTLTSETGYSRDRIYSFEDYNRFDTAPNVFDPGGGNDDRFDIVDQDGVFCDPQLGCTNRLAAGDLSTARSQQFSQEFRLSSDFDGPFNFGVGANFLRYDTQEKYYVFANTLTMWGALQTPSPSWQPGVTDNAECLAPDNFYGRAVSDPSQYWSVFGCIYVDPNDIHHLNDQGRNYFLSSNPYHLISYAGFGEAYYEITDALKLTAGLRWTVDKKTAPEIPSWVLAGPYGPNRNLGSSYGLPTYKVQNLEWREPTGRVALDWKPELTFTDETLVYGSYVRGYKAGGANPPPPVLVLATVCPPECTGGAGSPNTINGLVNHYLTHPETFDAEYVNAYEVGTKNTVLDGRLTANLSAFYYDYKGYQISVIVDRAAINFNYDAQVWGAELELDWRPLENLRLGFKGGYENTRVADGAKAIDLMDRTAGKEGWMVFRPFPTLPSNCVIPTAYAAIDWPGNTGIPGEIGVVPYPTGLCAAYILGLDPMTYLPYVPNPTVSAAGPIPDGYPGYDPASANGGQGFEKDLGGNQLPNAPAYTATITADYTLPLGDWMMTLHGDFYQQSEAWTRIFNTPGYDKLKAYNNINLAAIFTNEDAGWYVMAYVKNVLDKNNITGAFLNSDDTGLTTNVFLNEPRLYGIRVTKDWTGGSLLGTFGRRRDGEGYPFTVEVGAQMVRRDTPAQALVTFDDAFTGALDPGGPQTDTLDWDHASELRLTYRPDGSPWSLTGGVRYGRINHDTGRQRQEEVTGEGVCDFPTTTAYSPYVPGVDISFLGKLRCDPEYGPVTKDLGSFGEKYFTNKYDSDSVIAPTNRLSSSTYRREEHLIVDFTVGKDVGLGAALNRSSLSAGLRYADFKSSVRGDVRGVPDLVMPDDAWTKYPSTFHQYAATFASEREFKGAGPTVSWEASKALWEDAGGGGQLSLDWAVTGGALFGKQKTTVAAAEGETYFNDPYPQDPAQWILNGLQPPTLTPLDIQARSESATVPVLDLSLGLSYEVPGVKLSTGYRWERYFDVLDAGFQAHESYDRTLDGPYIKVSIGLGG